MNADSGLGLPQAAPRPGRSRPHKISSYLKMVHRTQIAGVTRILVLT